LDEFKKNNYLVEKEDTEEYRNLRQSQDDLYILKNKLEISEENIRSLENILRQENQANIEKDQEAYEKAKGETDLLRQKLNKEKSDKENIEKEIQTIKKSIFDNEKLIDTYKAIIEGNKPGLYTQEDLDKSKEKLEKAKKRRNFVDKIEWDKYNVVSFYEWIIDNFNDSDEVADAKKAIEAINMYPDMIDLDNLNDSTNINNVKAALNYLEDINELRRNDENFKNLSDLKTNHVIMAMAISNAAHSINGHLSHFLEVPGYYNRLYAENLAYTPNNPYNGWYYREKDAYNYLMNEYDNFNPYSNLSEEQRKEIQDLFGISSIGHYLIIVNQDATTVGMGRDTTPEKVGPYGGIYALNFSTESDAKKSVSIEEYIKRYDDFLSYIDDYESRKELEDAQSEYEKIKNELTNPS
ncbi:MAG: CAP domain-containing protein, partial [Anaerococcus sp.]|nr:CAP domain-containing protein [Anaerococcus sp.]